jgi:glycosyltransferase involved in cell wall biosynthesis
MRVLHVVDSLAGSGGAEHGLVREITRFSPRIEQRVVRLYERAELEPLLTESGIEVTALGFEAASGSRTFLQAAMRLRPIVRSYRPDVIHTSLFLGNLVGQITARSTGVPVLSTFVLSGDLALLKSTQPGAASRKAAAIRRIASVSARMSHARFRALSNDARITNCRLLGVSPDLVEVIPRGVPEPVEALMARADLGLPEDVPLIVNVARVAAQKGQVHLLRSFAALRAIRPDAHLVIVGRAGDAEKSVADEISRLGLSGHVTMLGYTPFARHVVSHASVFAFSSLMEGLGTAVIEALVAKVPVVAFDIPPVRDATDDGHGARLVEVGDEAGFTKALLAGLDGELASVAEHGARFAATNGNLDDISARLERLLIAVASGASVGANSPG